MKKIKILLLLLLTHTSINIAQAKKSTKLGKTTLEELKMSIYDKDSTAAAVVLYEHANVYLDPNNDYNTRTDYYYRIKIFNKSAFDLANISIDLYKKERLVDLKAITYNINDDSRIVKNNLMDKDVFTIENSESWKTKKFTLSKIKEGSVIEYKYSVLSPYLGLDDWTFQSEIPKIKSEFDAAVLGNYKYHVRLIGYLNLDKDNPSIKKKCVYIDGVGEGACIIYSYGMNNVPAFKKEEYMLSKKNYLARITFDLISYTDVRGDKTSYTTTWKKADKKLKAQFFNNQTSKKSFFRKNLPENLFSIENELKKAKEIYKFIQNHYTWNDKNWTNEDAKVKTAFNEKSGNVGEINVSLYNSLTAANINTNLVVLSTRNNGIPTKLHPVIYDYNYVIVKVNIDDKDYYLDATDKFLPFGLVPIRTLNGEARVINYEKEGNWTYLEPTINSNKNINSKLTLNAEGVFTGNLFIRKTGYYAQKQRKKLASLSKDSYLDEVESKHVDLEVEDYKVVSKDLIEKPITEVFKVKIFMNEDLGNTARINPFIFERINVNPFKLKERNYPVDFAHPFKSTFSLSLTIPKEYKVSKLPKNKAIALPNKGGTFIIKSEQKDNTINLYVSFSINRKTYTSEEYFALKEYFKQIIIAENSFILLEKNKV